ncbi:hypothetical protein CLU96_2954 [Chryseobacterium sp. 52]|uniref:hypothetical protein n=1 Tax=Chryseobacterium sp. 52 TaxID=2035213 RepID=UPI000C177403|nr:hypothetical protein [Chryseobacterium sp. 52]PIF45938.1 hypothetical protein CLU96_2954 [Chryseobacterium sp. 52]
MELRKEIEPDFDTAEKLYPEILQLILEYTDECDENGDEDHTAYKKLENTLHEMTGKEMSRFNLWEWWEADGAENLAFDIALPDPKIIDNITKNELSEIVRKLKTFEVPGEDTESFKAQFYSNVCFGNGYYYQFLKLNFKTYNLKLFQRNKDKSGNYFEYSLEETTERLWNNKQY